MKMTRSIMRAVITTITLVAIVPLVLMCQSQPWESIGPPGADIRVLVQHPGDKNSVFAITVGSPSLVFKSSDFGQKWTKISTLNDVVRGLVIDPRNPESFIAYSVQTIFTSSDGGRVWASRPFLQPSTPGHTRVLNQLTFDPGSAAVLHGVGTYWDGMTQVMAYFKSTDRGISWTQKLLSLVSGSATVLKVEQRNPSHVYVGGYIVGGANLVGKLFKSTNGGVDFDELSCSIPGSVQDIRLDSSTSGRIFVSALGGVFRSSDGGSTWLKDAATMSGFTMLGFDPGIPNLLYAGNLGNLVAKSTDGGINWTLVNSGIFGAYCTGLILDAANADRILLANSSGVFCSTNGGINWALSSDGIVNTEITAFCIAPASPSTSFAAVKNSAVYKTMNVRDGIVRWERLPVFYTCTSINVLHILPGDPNIVYALEGGG